MENQWLKGNNTILTTHLLGLISVTNNQIPDVDFATIHIYPEQWLAPNSSDEIQLAFAKRWIQVHIQDSSSVVKKPIIIGEFGKSNRFAGYSVEKRNNYFENVYYAIYSSARSKGPCAGGLFWQLMTQGMPTFGDEYEVVLEESPSTANIIAQQSRKLN
ncbi:Mannan endo-1,4-beta-mannosidase 4 [Melia azedarach]|uniref:Mannan endo-1,4-beta-mannosidase 4 n=1 Tax=Melia azedarach TaxID=155640 RepID=A0ACC1YZD9_MELAZ|nr:Mannan endo-1,4-beta-mannosidase 4 [Melia azedarach]